MVALDQDGGCVHLPSAKLNPVGFPFDQGRPETVFLPASPSGIAGSCVICGFDAWQTVGGYRRMGVYAGDDAFLFRDIADADFSVGLCETLRIIHPKDTDQDYLAWKMYVCHRDSDGSLRSDLTDRIEEAAIFWHSQGMTSKARLSAALGPAVGLITYHGTLLRIDINTRKLSHAALSEWDPEMAMLCVSTSAPFNLVQLLGDDVKPLAVGEVELEGQRGVGPVADGPSGGQLSLTRKNMFLTAHPDGTITSSTPNRKEWEGFRIFPCLGLRDVLRLVDRGGSFGLDGLRKLLNRLDLPPKTP